MLNRPAFVGYPSDASQPIGFGYDSATSDCATGERYLTGRLSQMTDASGSTSWCYDRYGQLTRKTQRTASRAYTLQYLWTPRPGQTSHGAGEGRLYGWRYPDGTEVRVVQDAQVTRPTACGRSATMACRCGSTSTAARASRC